ncbi:RNA polymerase sigma factor [Rhizocola hellebori]|uniref:RNA polymerase sigma factor n=1 Tax=Rhizocola hellebori TaxID=1392758 RepID=UPI001942BD81|nr:RNA polymerase sigma factor [Rhizocola hellebori]
MIQAWEEIYASQYWRLVTLMTALSGSVADAEEAVQEAFARGLGLSGRRPPPEDPAAWLYRVAANVVRGKWRRALVAHRHRGELAGESQVASAADHSDDRLTLLAAMRGLPVEQRETLALHYLADLPIDAIANRMDVPIGTVKARLSRGRNALAAVLTQDISPADELRSARQPEFSAVRARGTRRARRRIVAAVAILTAIISTGVVWGSSQLARPEPVTPSPSPSPSPSAVTPTTSPTPSSRVDPRNTTLTLPDPQFFNVCGKGGSLTFVDGIATIPGGTWSIGQMTPIEGDLDGAPGAELVTTISCSVDSRIRLVALGAAPGGELSVLGYVIAPDADLMFDTASVRIEAGVVQVTPTFTYGHTGKRCYPKQVRGYSYRDGSFKQTSGPTDVPDLTTEIRQLDLRNAPLSLDVPGPTPGVSHLVCASMTDGVGSGVLREISSVAPVTYAFTIEPKGFATISTRDFAFALVTYRADGGPEVQSVQVIHRGTDAFEGQTLVYTGVDGVTSIDGVTVTGNRAIVTVTVNGGKQEWAYITKSASSTLWNRE